MLDHRRLLLPLLLLTLAGCVSTQAVYTPDGRQGHTIDCSAYRHSWADCLAKASDLCGARGYDVLLRTGEPGAAAFAGTQVAGASPTMGRTMLIACK